MSRVWASALALALVVFGSGCTQASDSSNQGDAAISEGPWTTLSLNGLASVQVPARWYTTAYRGTAATVYFPSRFVSSIRFTGPCASGRAQTVCTTQNWFPADWRTPTDGVIALWSHAEFPGTAGPALSTLPGKPTTIDRRPAKVWTGPATSRCATGADTEVDASVRQDAQGYPGERFDLTACLGPAATPQDRTDVLRMLRSLRIKQ